MRRKSKGRRGRWQAGALGRTHLERLKGRQRRNPEGAEVQSGHRRGDSKLDPVSEWFLIMTGTQESGDPKATESLLEHSDRRLHCRH